jgi:XTP/dITP diphosphohydrolase
MAILVLATRNKDKVKEITEILSELKLEIRSLSDYPEIPDIVEDGSTFEENALKKARSVFEYTNLPTLSDDSGLEVFELGMKPGVLSARYAGEPTNYRNNNQKLLNELRNIPDDHRQAQFRCVVVFKTKKFENMREGVCEGKIIHESKGVGGFGYDPLFMPDGYNQTFAELKPTIKNAISHRGRALLNIRETLDKYFR